MHKQKIYKQLNTVLSRLSSILCFFMTAATIQAQTIPLCQFADPGETCITIPNRHSQSALQKMNCGPQDPNRSVDGTCNNINNMNCGATGINFRRDLLAQYGTNDPNNELNPRGGHNPRTISNEVSEQNMSIPSADGLSSMVFTWGQFLDHDITLTPLGDEDASIPIPPGDQHLNGMIPFTRSAFDPLTGGNTGIPRQQRNALTAWIDASNVYGSDAHRADWLRTGVDGKLKTSSGNLLPYNTNNNEQTGNHDDDAPESEGGPGPGCPFSAVFVAGDVRANEQPGLTTLHTLFVREHNRVCDDLIAQGATGDEAIYQKARQFVSGMIQNITFNEFLTTLGVQLPPYTGYNSNIKADISNVFATAAFRIGHTMVTEELLLADPSDSTCSTIDTIPLHQAFFNSCVVQDNGIDKILRGLALQTQQEIDAKIINGLRNVLFGNLDLAALNIQRGRDHGLPSYNDFRQQFLGTTATTFAHISADPDVQQALNTAYNGNINDIDPWVGMLAEDHAPNAQVGPLMLAILTDQFTRLRDGDFYYFENDPNLSASHKALIAGTTLADIIRRNTDANTIQDDPFHAQDCYCTPEFPDSWCDANTNNVFITSVELGNISNTGTDNSPNTMGYGNFSGQVANLVCDQATTLKVTLSTCSAHPFKAQADLGVWIDLNQNGEFDAEGEKIYDYNIHMFPNGSTIANCIGQQTWSGKRFFWNSSCPDPIVCIPIDANDLPAGPTRIRIITTHFNYPNPNGSYPSTIDVGPWNFDPCAEGYQIGEAEDYTINVNPPHVAQDQFTICHGESVQLEAIGGTTYKWFPEDDLDDPTSATPIATPSRSMIYQVKITCSDGSSYIDDVDITVEPETQMIMGPTLIHTNGNANLCYEVEDRPGSTYSWSINPPSAATITSGQGTNSIKVNWSTTSGFVEMVETNANNCTSNTNALEVIVRGCATGGNNNTTDPFELAPEVNCHGGGAICGVVTINNDISQAAVGDWIGAFDENGNCVGKAQLVSDGGACAPAYGGGSQERFFFQMSVHSSDMDPNIGMDPGELFTLQLYDASLDIYLVHESPNNVVQISGWQPQAVPTEPIPNLGCQDGCTPPIYDFEGLTKDTIILCPGSNLISIDVLPTSTAIGDVFATLSPNNLRHVTGFNTEGNNGATFFDPNGLPFLNTLHHIEPGQGYWVRVDAQDTLCVFGAQVDPAHRIELQPDWNLVGYVDANCEPVENYFTNLLTANRLEHVSGYNKGSTFFDPNGLPFLNTLQEVCNGLGYWVRLNGGTSVSNWKLAPHTKNQVQATNQFMFVNGQTNLGRRYAGQTIQVHTVGGLLVGEIPILANGYLLSTPIYGDDVTTEQVDGAVVGEDLIFTLNRQRLAIDLTYEGNLTYQFIRLNHRPSLIRGKVNQAAQHMLQVNPNPFQQLTNIDYTLEQDAVVKLLIYDISGKQAAVLVDQKQATGQHQVQWDATNYPSGTYLLHLMINEQLTHVEKLVVVE